MASIINQTLTANGSSDEAVWSPMRKGAPTRATVWAFGTFGGATVALEASPDNGVTWLPIPDQTGTPVQFITDGLINFELYADNNSDTKVRLTVSGAGATSINVIINDVN